MFRGRGRSLPDVAPLAAERVPHSMHGSDELRPLCVVSEDAPDVAHEHVQTCRVHMAVGPERRLELVLAHHLRSVSQQGGQQVERLPRQVNFRVAANELTRLGVERERSESGFHDVGWT